MCRGRPRGLRGGGDESSGKGRSGGAFPCRLRCSFAAPRSSPPWSFGNPCTDHWTSSPQGIRPPFLPLPCVSSLPRKGRPMAKAYRLRSLSKNSEESEEKLFDENRVPDSSSSSPLLKRPSSSLRSKEEELLNP